MLKWLFIGKLSVYPTDLNIREIFFLLCSLTRDVISGHDGETRRDIELHTCTIERVNIFLTPAHHL